jgi:hypothetical protein
MKIQKGELKFGSLHPHVQGGPRICLGGAFLLFSVWSLCFAWLVTFLRLSSVLVMS